MEDHVVVDLLKGVVIDGVHRAQSGHPGGAMSSMDFAYLLFSEFLQFSPEDPTWMGRDRFILSAGHESMLQYAMLYAQGLLTVDDLKSFRQLHSRTPGHPENGLTPGVECATGPLGQGAAMSVGFAIAAKHLGATLDASLFGHRTWALLGDGCMQECVTLGAASVAGHLKLSNLIWFYDKNCRQISGAIDRVTSDREEMIFKGFGWNVIVIDGHDHSAIRAAINSAIDQNENPTLIVGYTTMGKGCATMEGSHKTHGAPLPSNERDLTKRKLGIPEGAEFYWPDAAQDRFRRRFADLRDRAQRWQARLDERLHQDADFKRRYANYFAPVHSEKLSPVQWSKGLATRSAFGQILKTWYNEIPNLMGGSADLEPSNMTGDFANAVRDFSAQDPQGRNLAFGAREFPMAAICNGIALHGGFVPFSATFLVFSDYMRPALRLGAIQHVRVIHEFTHDSFYLGEDGPTHQPIEHLMSMRVIPNVFVMRPADCRETEVLMRAALDLHFPSCLSLSRQDLPLLSPDIDATKARLGAYSVHGSERCDIVIFATGSEVFLALKVAAQIEAGELGKAFHVRVISVPCWELFFVQPESYRENIMTRRCHRRVSIEAGATLGWERFVGHDGVTIGIDHYGASAKASALEHEFGFTVDHVLATLKAKGWAEE